MAESIVVRVSDVPAGTVRFRRRSARLAFVAFVVAVGVVAYYVGGRIGPRPPLSVPAARLDLGRQAPLERVDWTLPITNQSPTPWGVRLEASCECTALEPREFELAPGETRHVALAIDLEANSAQELEQPERQVELQITPFVRLAEASAGQPAEQALPPWTLRARVEQIYRFEPKYLSLINDHIEGRYSAPERAEVVCLAPVGDLHAECDERWGIATVASLADRPGAFQVEVSLNPELAAGDHEFVVLLSATTPQGAPLPPGKLRVWAHVEPATRADEGEHPHKLDEILTAWDARARAIGRLRFEWRENIVYKRGSLFLTGKARPKVGPGEKLPPVPTEDHQFETRYSLLLDGDDWRVDYHGPIWCPEEGRFENAVSRRAYGGDLSAMWVSALPAAGVPPIGSLALALREQLPTYYHESPIFLALRPTQQAYGKFAETKNYRLERHWAEHSGRRCVVIGGLRGGYAAELRWQQLSERYWLDPRLAFNVVHFEERVGGDLVLQADVDYELTADQWLPTRWQCETFGGEERNRSSREVSFARVDVVSLDPPRLEGELSIAFPEGTVVHDRYRGRELVVPLGSLETTESLKARSTP